MFELFVEVNHKKDSYPIWNAIYWPTLILFSLQKVDLTILDSLTNEDAATNTGILWFKLIFLSIHRHLGKIFTLWLWEIF